MCDNNIVFKSNTIIEGSRIKWLSTPGIKTHIIIKPIDSLIRLESKMKSHVFYGNRNLTMGEDFIIISII